MDVLVPPVALCLGLVSGGLVYRDAEHRQVSSPRLWAGFVGATFSFAPVVLAPALTPVYYRLFVPHGLVLVVRPLHALVTILGGGSLVGLGSVLVYLHHRRRRSNQVTA